MRKLLLISLLILGASLSACSVADTEIYRPFPDIDESQGEQVNPLTPRIKPLELPLPQDLARAWRTA